MIIETDGPTVQTGFRIKTVTTVLQAAGASVVNFSQGDVVQLLLNEDDTSKMKFDRFQGVQGTYGDEGAYFGVLLEDINYGKFGKVLLSGYVQAYTLSSQAFNYASGATGVPWAANNSIQFELATATTGPFTVTAASYNATCVASLVTAVAGMSATRAKRYVLFDGITGWGGRSAGGQ